MRKRKLNADDNWGVWALGILIAVLILVWLFVVIAKIIAMPVILFGIVFLLYGVANDNEEALKVGGLLIGAGILLLILIAAITASPIWQPAEDTMQYIFDLNVLKTVLPKPV